MDRQLIKDLIDALQASGLSELEYARGDEMLRLVRNGAPDARTAVAPSPMPSPSAHAAPLPVPAPAPIGVAPPAAPTVAAAPLFGVVHLQPAPGAPPFVAAGQAVEVDQVLCTVEAMKVFTQVRAGRAGTVAAVLVADGQEVEPGQALVRLS